MSQFRHIFHITTEANDEIFIPGLFKEIYSQICPSLCPSVCPSVHVFSPCSHHQILLKFAPNIHLTKWLPPVTDKVQGLNSKVKVTRVIRSLVVSVSLTRTYLMDLLHIWHKYNCYPKIFCALVGAVTVPLLLDIVWRGESSGNSCLP